MKSVPVPAASINRRGSCKIVKVNASKRKIYLPLYKCFVCVQLAGILVHTSKLIVDYLIWYPNICTYFIFLTLEGLKLAAAIGPPRTVNTANQRPPRRRKNDPGPSSPQEYKTPSFRDEYSFTYYTAKSGLANMK